MRDEEQNRDFVTALARGLEVLQACGSGGRGLTLAEIAELVGLPRATVRRSLLTFAELGYAETDGRLFRLTPKVLKLSAAYLGSTPLPRVAQPVLERLSATLGESCSISVLDGAEIVYVARSQATRILAEELAIGSRLPVWPTAMGRVLLADRPEQAVTDLLGKMPPRKHTELTLTDPAALRTALEQVRAEGYCIVDQELEQGLRSIATPVRSASGSVVAALNVGTHAGRWSIGDLRRQIRPALQEAAASMQPLLVL
ncbi:MAG: helix-turn-helix domain-containing protein [Acetobacteraceae bacterium]|nr:helix-turn-helix domain-containing protein [Acetobacteraceae bacterium]